MKPVFKKINTGFVKFFRANASFGYIEISGESSDNGGKYKAIMRGRHDPSFPRFYFSKKHAKLEMISYIRRNS